MSETTAELLPHILYFQTTNEDDLPILDPDNLTWTARRQRPDDLAYYSEPYANSMLKKAATSAVHAAAQELEKAAKGNGHGFINIPAQPKEE